MPGVGKEVVRRRYAKLRLGDAMLTSASIQQAGRKPIVARQKERGLDTLQVGGFDVRVQLAEFDGAVILKSGSVAIRNLDEEHQLAVAATAFQASAIYFGFNSRYEALVKREFCAGRC